MWDITYITLNYTAELWLFLEFATPFKTCQNTKKSATLSIPTLASITRRPAGYDLMAVEYRTGYWLKMAEAKQKHTIIESMLVQELHFAIVLAVRKGSLLTVSHCVPMEIWQSRVALPPGCTFFLQSKLQDWASNCM